MVPTRDGTRTISLQVLRFTTPVHDAGGTFVGYLMLSLDLKELRDIISTYSAPDAPIAAYGEDVRLRTLFFDRDGWMLFQSETPDADLPRKDLATDGVRAGFTGDFGRPGFSNAFRPGPEYIRYWDMGLDNASEEHSAPALRHLRPLLSGGDVAARGVGCGPVALVGEGEDMVTTLQEIGFLRFVHDQDGGHRYIACPAGHTHYLVCRGCGRACPVTDCNLGVLEKLIAAQSGFSVEGHHLEFFGLCPQCLAHGRFNGIGGFGPKRGQACAADQEGKGQGPVH